MPDWKSIIEAFFENSDPTNEFRHLANPGASAEAIEAAEKQLGISLPEELRDFYLCFNGVGMAGEDESDEPRFIRPVEMLPAFINESRSSFAGTHSELASRFLPFIDWDNGDATGYLLQQDGTLFPGLVTFEHETYHYDATQDAEEFMTPGPDSLADFLSGGE
ncbi:SMI1/KNR4 family protein [Blastopirellula marina]|uniref:Knr4/Smi1-like domain-containing protein n=1 Tax=Blastopirellula marina TaxID=124 RepID=A0A2S8GRB8_9BACT|nr:SMI1/KNR4 family protein [Blastopirellula marina]PQO46977.1 hypothetical protein C5Y93_05620 [Blastopirellula marina]